MPNEHLTECAAACARAMGYDWETMDGQNKGEFEDGICAALRALAASVRERGLPNEVIQALCYEHGDDIIAAFPAALEAIAEDQP